MKEKRFYYDGELKASSNINLIGDEFHHLSSVMRAKKGDKVCLFNGNGNFYFGEIVDITKKYAEIFINEEKQSENEPKVDLTVFQALAKGDKLSLIMQKITEIGANKLCLFESDFCDVKSNTHRHDRLESVSISASKQCGRATIVQTEGVFTLKEVANEIKNYDAFFVAYENEDGHTLVDSLLNPSKTFNKVAVVIGSEGGFSEKEIQLLKNNGADIVSLGKRILRTETASILCSSIIMQFLENK